MQRRLAVFMTKSAQWFDFGVGEKIANARTCADSDGRNFWKIENVEGFLHIFAYKGLKLTAV